MSKVLCVIAARAGSKGVPKKNLRLLGSKPLVWHAFKKALAAKRIDKVVCSTDSEEVAQIAREAGVEVPFMRPLELSGDRVALIDVTKHMMLEMDKRGFRSDIVVQLSPTCPFIKPERLDESVQLLLDSDASCAVSLKRVEHEHPYRAKELLEGNYFRHFIKDVPVEKFLNRQDLPALYVTNGGIYTRRRELLEAYQGQDFAFGKKPRGLILNEIESINIDTPIDFDFAEFLFHKGLS